MVFVFFFFKQKTAYEIVDCDWSSDVCSSDFKEKPNAILPTMGGQTALNLAMEAEKKGILKKYNIELIGANSKAISNAEDRKKFRKNMIEIGLDLPKSQIVNNINQASKALKKIGLPAIIRPAFTLGGLGGGIAKNKKDFKKIYNLIYPVIMNLKYQYNRPRPEQLAERLGFKVNVVKTKTHQTPAYPSGHTVYAAIGAYLLADMYPELSSDFFRKIGETGLARCLQGVHYPSDNEASMVISGAIWQDLRYKLFPDLEPYRKV